MELIDILDISKFLHNYPNMSLVPSRNSNITLKGKFEFSAQPKNGEELTDSFEIEIIVPATFPRTIPVVKEIGEKIPHDGNYHINSDATLCLGSPLRLLRMINDQPNLIGFSEKCLVPYLYAVSKKLQNGEKFIFGELPHGEEGIIVDYMQIFGFVARCQVIQALNLMSIRPRLANKKPCPCACGRRLGRCPFRHNLNNFRLKISRSWFKEHMLKLDLKLPTMGKNSPAPPKKNNLFLLCSDQPARATGNSAQRVVYRGERLAAWAAQRRPTPSPAT